MTILPDLLPGILGGTFATMNAPLQTISAGHARFVDVSVFQTVVDSTTGVASAVLDTTSTLVLSCNHPEACVATVASTNNRRVVLTAGTLAPGSQAVGWTVFVQSDPAAPTPLNIPGNTTAPPNLNRIDFVADGDA